MDIVGSASAALPQIEALVDEVLVPGAELVDQFGVQRVALDHLADAGLLGTPLATPEQRELSELIARADASTWFCWTQHQAPSLILRNFAQPEAAAAHADLLEDLAAGERLAGVAFAHVRRPGPPNPLATRVDGGWLINGTLDGVTRWEIADGGLGMVATETGYLGFFMTGGEGP